MEGWARRGCVPAVSRMLLATDWDSGKVEYGPLPHIGRGRKDRTLSSWLCCSFERVEEGERMRGVIADGLRME